MEKITGRRGNVLHLKPKGLLLRLKKKAKDKINYVVIEKLLYYKKRNFEIFSEVGAIPFKILRIQ